MPSWVDLNDADAARAAGEQIAALSGQLSGPTNPPVAWGGPEWGSDDFAAKILENHEYPDLLDQIVEYKQQLGEFMTELGEGVQQAVAEYLGEEYVNKAELDQVIPPNL